MTREKTLRKHRRNRDWSQPEGMMDGHKSRSFKYRKEFKWVDRYNKQDTLFPNGFSGVVEEAK